ncbi:7144_t:CDS:2, partial [Acaulospora colombiana]
SLNLRMLEIFTIPSAHSMTGASHNGFMKLVYQCPRSGATLQKKLEQLPDTRMPWKTIDVWPSSGNTSSPVVLYHRDPVKCIQSLLDRPHLQDALEFAPRRSWEDENRQSRLYSEMLTGEWAWRTQGTLPPGSTLVPVLLGSDKTHLTVFAGDKKAWPLYLSIGNIKSSVRNKPRNRAWCMSVILEPLKHIPTNGLPMTDSVGAVRLCFPRLAAYLADYPEQVLINVARSNASPTTTASYRNLGDPFLFPPRTRDYIVQAISQVKAKVDPANVGAYQRAAKKIGLNGVDQPFWKDLPGYMPNVCVAPDILHGVHRFWRDHVLDWVINLVGAEELDRR